MKIGKQKKPQTHNDGADAGQLAQAQQPQIIEGDAKPNFKEAMT